MKFKRILAVLLSTLMLASAMSFTATVSAADGVIKENVLGGYTAYRGSSSTPNLMYDETADIGFSRIYPSTAESNQASSCYVNIGDQNITFTEEQLNGEAYIVLYARTNMTMNDDELPLLYQYQCSWSDGTNSSSSNESATQVTDGYATILSKEWQKFCFKLVLKKTADFDNNSETPNTVGSLTRWNQVAFLAAGTGGATGTKPISEWFTSVSEGETPYVDFAGYAVVDSIAAAAAYDFTATAKAPRVTLTFDKGLAEDDTDVVTETPVAGKWTGAKVSFPEITAPDGYGFVGWYEDAEYTTKIEDTTAVTVPDANEDYYARFEDTSVAPSIASLKINLTDASKYGVKDINAESINVTLPYGWERLWALGVKPAVTVEPDGTATASYTDPASLSDAGKIVLEKGTQKKEISVTFTVSAKPADKVVKPTLGIAGNSKYIDPTTGNEVSGSRTLGVYPTKGIKAHGIENVNLFTPIYSTVINENGVSVTNPLIGTLQTGTTTDIYSNNRSTALEGAFNSHDFETWDMIRVLVYYETGGDGFDAGEIIPYMNSTGYSTSYTGTFYETALKNGKTLKHTTATGAYKGDRWEYVYFTKGEFANLYGKASQQHYYFMGNNAANKFTNDKLYVAELRGLADSEALKQYQPVELVATAIDGDTLGTVSNLTNDMELLVGEEWKAITTVEGYENGTLTGLEAGEYSFRYAATDTLLASEATTVEVLPDEVLITFDAQNGDDPVETDYLAGAAITAPATPVRAGYIFKGWAESTNGTPVDLTGAVANGDKTYYGIWELITTVYVNSTVATAGNGLTADAPFKYIQDAINTLVEGGTIVLTGEVWGKNETTIKKPIKFTSVDPVTQTDYPGTLVINSQFRFNNDPSLIEFENLELASWRGGQAGDKYQYIQFNGHSFTFGKGITVKTGNVPDDAYCFFTNQKASDTTDITEVYYTIRVRAAADGGVYTTVDGKRIVSIGEKMIIRTDSIGEFHAAGTVDNNADYYINNDIDLEYYGGNTLGLNIGNNNGKINLKGAKVLLETTPKSVNMNNVTSMSGAYQFIANNGVETVPTVSVEPALGKWIIHSAQGGRVDFTETAGTFAVTTDADYIIVTDNATGVATRTRLSDGVSGDAALFADGDAYELTLNAGDYSIAYTSEAVKISVTFENGDADETYTVAKGETATFVGTVTAPAGKVFAGWVSVDGQISLDGNSYTADKYYEGGIVFTPVYEDATNVPYYYSYGEYDANSGTYTVDVKIANGKFTAGTLGATFNPAILKFKSYSLAAGIGNDLGDAPEIVKDYMYDGQDDKFILVWNATEATGGLVDASADEVSIVSFVFDVVDATAVKTAIDNGTSYAGADFFIGSINYEKYFVDGYYLASPQNTTGDPYAVEYVPVYYGETVNKEKSYEKADVTFEITFASKSGATTSNIGQLSIWKDGEQATVLTVDAEGNTEKTVTKVVSDYYVGDTINFKVEKNGYLPVEVEDVVAKDGMTIKITLLAGDIKDDASAFCGNGEITLADFVRIVRAFDEDNTTAEFKQSVNLDESLIVDVTDLGILKSNFGKTSKDNTVEYVYAN